MTEQTIIVERLEEAVNLFGSLDENVKLIERELDVAVVSRDGRLKITGEDGEKVIYAVKAGGPVEAHRPGRDHHRSRTSDISSTW